MRKLTYGMNLSLVGYIAAPGDDLGWSVRSDEMFQWWSDRVRATVLALYGRKLWETNKRAAEEPNPAMVSALRTAATNPAAPDALRRIVGRVDSGELAWSDVLGGADEPDIQEFRSAAFTLAQSRADDVDADSGKGTASDGIRR